MKVIRSELSANAVSPTNLRYNATCDCIQQTPDGGTTWVDVPEADPRHADGFRLPPLSGPDARCDAAAREVAAWREVYDTFIASTDVGQFATIILNILLLLAGGVGVLIGLLFLVFEALIFIGKENMEAAFDDDVWDAISCIVYCHIGSDGSVSQPELDAIYADILAVYPGVIYNTLIEIGHLFGEVLISNASVERDETGDCTGCACEWCWNFDSSTNLSEWTPVDHFGFGPDGTWTGTVWQSHTFTGVFTVSAITLLWEFDDPITLTGVRGFWNTYPPYNPPVLVVNGLDQDTTEDEDGFGRLYGGGIAVTSIQIQMWTVSNPGTWELSQVVLTGLGENPFGEDNCE